MAAEAVSQGDAGGDGHRLSRHVEQIVQALIDSGIGLRRVGQREVSAGADWDPPRWHVDQDMRRRRARRQPGQQGRRPGSDVVVRVGDPTDDLPAGSRGDVIAVHRPAHRFAVDHLQFLVGEHAGTSTVARRSQSSPWLGPMDPDVVGATVATEEVEP